jgi:hypothetical protein
VSGLSLARCFGRTLGLYAFAVASVDVLRLELASLHGSSDGCKQLLIMFWPAQAGMEQSQLGFPIAAYTCAYMEKK